MNRRSLLAFIGLAPVVAPAALATASKSVEATPIDYVAASKTHPFTFDGGTLQVPALRFPHIELMADGSSRYVFDTDSLKISG